MTCTDSMHQASDRSSPSHWAGQRSDIKVRCKQQFEVKPTTLGGMIEGSELETVQPPKPEPTGVELAMDARDNNYGVHDSSSKVQAPTSDSALPAGLRPAAKAGKLQVVKRNTEVGDTLDHKQDGLPNDLQVNDSHAAGDRAAGRPLGVKEPTRKHLLPRETQVANAMNHDHNGMLTGDAPSESSEYHNTYSDVDPAGCYVNGKEYAISHICPRQTRVGNAINHAHHGPLTGDAPLTSSASRMDPATAQDRAAGQSAFAEASGYSRKVRQPRATSVGRTMRMSTFQDAEASKDVKQAGAAVQEYGLGRKRCTVNRRRESIVFDSRSSQIVRRYSSGLGMDSIRAAGRIPLERKRGMMHFTHKKQGEDRDEMSRRKIREAALRKEIAATQNSQAPSAGLPAFPRTQAKKTFGVVCTKDVLVEHHHAPKSLLRSRSVDHSSSVAAGQRVITELRGIGMVNIEKQKPTYAISQITGNKVPNFPAGQRLSGFDFVPKCREIDPKSAGRDMVGIFKNDLANNPQSSNVSRTSFLGKPNSKPQGIRVFKETTSSFSNLGFQAS